MSLSQILLILRARWRVVLSVFGATFFAVVFLSVIWPKQYTAVSSLVIDTKSDPVGGGMALSQQLMASYVNTQADVVASRRVAQKVVKSLHLQDDPALQKRWQKETHGRGDFSVWLADYLIDRKVNVAPVHDSPTHASNVIEISVMWPDPALASAMANEFAQASIETNIELKVEPAKQYAAWFSQRSQGLRADLAEKQRKLSDFQSSSGLVATDEKLDVENARLTELSTQLVAIQGLRQESQSRQRGAGGDNEALPEVLQSPVIQSLKAELSQAEAKRPDIAARLGKNHPDYQAIDAQISDLRERIVRESASIAASLGSVTQVNVRRENDVRLALESQKKKVLDLKHFHDEAAILQSDVVAAQRDLDAVSERYAQSSLESQANQTNVVRLTAATPPLGPSSPKVVLNAMLAIFFGAIFGVGAALSLEMMQPRFRQDDDLTQLLGVPILGKMSHVKKRAVHAANTASTAAATFDSGAI